MQRNISYLKWTVFVCVCYTALFLVYEKFPLMCYGDSYQYIYGYTDNFISESRPIFYSIIFFIVNSFLNIFWVPLLQAFIVSISCYLVLKNAVSERTAAIITIFSFIFSSQPILVTTIEADAYTLPLIFFTILLINARRRRLVFLYGASLFSISLIHVSYSTILVLIGLMLAFLSFCFTNVSYKISRSISIVLIGVLSSLILSGIYFYKFDKFSPSLHTELAIFSKLTQLGITYSYLTSPDGLEHPEYTGLADLVLGKDYGAVFWEQPNGPLGSFFDASGKKAIREIPVQSELKKINRLIIKSQWATILLKVPYCLAKEFYYSKILRRFYIPHFNDKNQIRVEKTFGEAAIYSRQQTGGSFYTVLNAYAFVGYYVTCLCAIVAWGTFFIPVRFGQKTCEHLLVFILFFIVVLSIYSLFSDFDPRYSACLQMGVIAYSAVLIQKGGNFLFTKISQRLAARQSFCA